MVVAESFHQVASCQVLIGREYTVAYLTRNAHEHGKSCTGTDEYSFKAFFFHELVDRGGFTDNHVRLNLNT